MRFKSLQYSVGEGLANLARNRLMTAASIVTVAACVFMMAVSYCLAANIDHVLAQMEDTLKITVIVSDDATNDEVTSLLHILEGTPHVTRVTYVSAQDALDSVKKEWNDAAGILDGLDKDNPLPRSFVLDVDQVRYISGVSSSIAGLKNPAVDKINQGQDVANGLMMINGIIRIVSLVMVLGLGVVSIVIITNTIRLAVNARKTEINIMKYVGATDWFIRWPFIVEGVVIGIIGALVPVILCWFGYGRVLGLIEGKMPILNLDYLSGLQIFSVLLPLALLLGVFLGVFGSLTSIRRHLNV
ncbi:MAG: permease-like cell division protein FtsX [Firmicutes bacterium]|nr:permease-like cell division protein FtsX [Bacillota bacterium]